MEPKPKLAFSDRALNILEMDRLQEQAGQITEALLQSEEASQSLWNEWMKHVTSATQRSQFEEVAQEMADSDDVPIWRARATLATIVLAHNGSFERPDIPGAFLKSRPMQPMQIKPKPTKTVKKKKR
ncbi:MAG: hypothetical protein V4671_22975 [Armatimonadota bacterium]